jgi:digeranylgeranylglycerophospholipid reductase
MKAYDVLIVGGGPIGGHVAERIAEKKYTVAVFEKKRKIGVPMNCAGLVTQRVFDFLDISKNDVIKNEVKGANIHSPSGSILSIGGDRVHALVIDRTKFDQKIIKNAQKKGAEVFTGCKVKTVSKSKNYIEVETSKNLKVRGKILIGADGPHSLVRKQLNFPKPHEYLNGIGAEISDANLESDMVEIFVGNNIAPSFFAWIIPLNGEGTRARIGLCTNQNTEKSPKFYFDALFKNKFTVPYLENIKIEKNIGGLIPLGFLKKTYDSNVMLVGDAAAQVKPTSGGGIYPGLLCADHCANVAVNALTNNDFSHQFLKKYQKLWIKDLGRELSMGIKFRSFYKRFSDKQFDKYIKFFQNPKVINTVNKYGDIDYPSKLLKPLLKVTPMLFKTYK